MNTKKVISALVMSVVAMAPAMAEDEVVLEESQWESSADFGLSLSKGNTDSLLLRLGLKTEKKDGPDAYFGSVSYNYGEEDSASTQDEILGEATWKHAYSGKNFFGLRMDARRDTFADIDYRLSLNTTYGYYWLDTETTVFSTELGLGVTTEDKGDGSTTYLNGLFAQDFEHKFNENAKFYQSLIFAPRLDNFGDYRIEFEMGIETKISETLSFKVSFEDRYESRPAEGKEENDLQLITGLSYKF
ncbi:MAG: putative salt-induced outer membrane protein YdiY [Crocinitomicaceae bacterium]|jgi:putative salt-induced outer membrane protein YdiY